MNNNKIFTERSRAALMICVLGLSTILAVAAYAPQDKEEDEQRHIWNLKFQQARSTKKTPDPPKLRAGTKGKAETTDKADQPTESGLPAVEGELIGVTFWRLRPGEGQRLLQQKVGTQTLQFLPERVSAETQFTNQDKVRLGIEAPRQTDGYLYIIDREVYADGTKSDPYLIFPLQTTRRGDNLIKAGKLIEIPARDDQLPFFDLSAKPLRADRVSEELTLIITPKPLDLPLANEPLKLAVGQVAKWEKDWGGQVEHREAKREIGKTWTEEEMKAGIGKRILRQNDPLPQTIYRINAKPGQALALQLQLRVAP